MMRIRWASRKQRSFSTRTRVQTKICTAVIHAGNSRAPAAPHFYQLPASTAVLRSPLLLLPTLLPLQSPPLFYFLLLVSLMFAARRMLLARCFVRIRNRTEAELDRPGYLPTAADCVKWAAGVIMLDRVDIGIPSLGRARPASKA